MKKAGLFLIFISLISVFVFSQSYRGQGRLIGVVYDQDGKPLEGVKVKLFSQRGGAGFELTTDAKGEWKANYIRGGGWNIDFEKAGYLPQKISVNIQESSQNPPMEIKLKKAEGAVITEEFKAALEEGNRLFEEKKYEEAIKAYEGIINANPYAYIINKNIGNCYFQLQKYDIAEEYYRKVLEKESDNAEVMLLIGNSYANRGENEKAMEWYNKIPFEKITDQMVLFNIGSSFYSQSKFEDALNYYKRAIEIQKDFLDAIYWLGLTYIALGNNQEALATFESYLKYDSSSEMANRVKGFIEFLKKKN
jgi:tetratricopeptide (TPR) repeat protein